MKKITTILMLLMLTCMGAWAQTVINIGSGQGTFFDSKGTPQTIGGFNAIKFVSNATPTVTLEADADHPNAFHSSDGRIGINDAVTTITISVPEGYQIKEYQFEAKAVNSGHPAKTFTPAGEGARNIPADATWRPYQVVDVNAQSTYFTLVSTGWAPINTRSFKVTVEKVDYTTDVEANIKPLIESIGNGYFTLDPNNTAVQTLQNAYNSHIGDTWTQAEYDDLLALLNAAKASENAYIMPETGYYRIKNNAFDFYAGYSEGSNPAADNRATGASTVVYLEKDETTGKYAIKINGKYIQTTGIQYSGGNTFTMGDDVAYFNVFARGNINSDGKGTGSFTALDDEGGTNRSYLIIENDPAPSHGKPLTTWGPGKIGSHWILEDATTLELPLTNIAGKNYATTCLPFPVKLSEAAAYKVTLSGKKAVEEQIGDEIPANIPVLLISNASTTLTATIQETTATVDCGDLKGVLVKTAKANLEGTIPVVFNQVDGKAGFYKLADGSSLSANRAYLSYVEGTTPQSAKAFFEEGFELGGNEATAIENIENGAFENGAVYNLQGQRVTKAQKGVFIVNGKKIVK